jgi:superfamily II RNA helicase
MPAPHDPSSRPSSTDESVPFGYLPEEPEEQPVRKDPAPEAGGDESERPRRRRRRRRSGAEGQDPAPETREESSPGPAPSPEEEPRQGRPPRAPEALADGRVVEWHGFRLLPFQIQAVDAVRNGHNVLVAAPTGAGKTLVAEYAVEDAVKRGKRVVYTSPIKALSSQKYRDFKEDPAVEVGIMTGDVTLHPRAQVLVMTTEILRNAIFENPELIEDVEFVVFDEVHFLDDRERGMVWEECFIFLPPHVRLICLSATIQNVDELGAWIGQVRPQDNVVILEDRRPVPLSHWVHTESAATFPPARLNHHRKKAGEAVESEKRARRGSRRTRGGGRGRGRERQGPPERPDAKGLIDELVDEGHLPALVFSFSRKDVERLAHRNQRRELLDDAERTRMEALQEELLEVFQLPRKFLRGELMQMALRGVAFHHAGLLPVHKELVERMFTAGLIKLLFTTETFALGINMPARSVVFSQLRKYDGISMDWLRTRDYMQMAGRAGRQGIDDKGFVYSVLSDRELTEAPLERLFAGKPEPVTSRFRLSYSTILHLVEAAGRERLYEAWERSFAQYQVRGGSRKAREHQRLAQRREVDRRLGLLEDLGYLEDDRVTPRGKIARLLSGHEIQVTELLFSGALENLPGKAVVMIFVALIHEERGRFKRNVPAKVFGGLRRVVSNTVERAASLERRAGIEPGMKLPDWGLSEAAIAWYGGAPVEDLEDCMDATLGDFCRVLRMAIQLMRNTRRSIDREWDLATVLDEAVTAVNRDEIDARRQLELG